MACPRFPSYFNVAVLLFFCPTSLVKNSHIFAVHIYSICVRYLAAATCAPTAVPHVSSIKLPPIPITFNAAPPLLCSVLRTQIKSVTNDRVRSSLMNGALFWASKHSSKVHICQTFLVVACQPYESLCF